MLTELFSAISKQAIAANGVQSARFLDNTKEYLLPPGGELQILDVPRPRRHQFHSLESLLDGIEKWSAGGTVWHEASAITVLFDDGIRADYGVLLLHCSEERAKLNELEFVHGGRINQRDFVRLLRHTLHGTEAESILLPLIKRVTWERSSTGAAEIHRGKESLGRSVEEQVSATADLPEQIRFKIPIYDTPGCRQRQTVSYSIDVEPADQMFRFCPLPGELLGAIDAEQDDLHELLAASGSDVFYGSPDEVS